jgi:hypothetical protein
MLSLPLSLPPSAAAFSIITIAAATISVVVITAAFCCRL